jgi:microcystin-dependent protein
MSDFFVGEIEMFGFGFAPKGWALCNGQLLPIAQNQALFSLLGTTFGGDGIRTFALPNLQGRTPVGQGNGPGLTPRVLGQAFGEEQHTLLNSENPMHNHAVNAIAKPNLANNTDVPSPNQFLAQTSTTGGAQFGTTNLYVADKSPQALMNPGAVGVTGGNPHSNLMPLLTVNFCIALTGIFPSRN